MGAMVGWLEMSVLIFAAAVFSLYWVAVKALVGMMCALGKAFSYAWKLFKMQELRRA